MINRSNTKILSFVFLLLLLGVFAFRQFSNFHHENSNKSQHENVSPVDTQSNERSINENSSDQIIPSNVYKVLDHVRKYGQAPNSYEGGREFKNREHRLKDRMETGRRIHYREWDVHPKVEGRNRGAERLVTGDDDKAWYTDDHYQTFTELNKSNE